ncbi:MAG: hypothetical protein BGP25_05335 [Lysobacterales bacterium 63-13]|nr:MAG: hypothetical protein BGP25_05335 [Xanthomonadales bacterium 63-13]
MNRLPTTQQVRKLAALKTAFLCAASAAEHGAQAQKTMRLAGLDMPVDLAEVTYQAQLRARMALHVELETVRATLTDSGKDALDQMMGSQLAAL